MTPHRLSAALILGLLALSACSTPDTDTQPTDAATTDAAAAPEPAPAVADAPAVAPDDPDLLRAQAAAQAFSTTLRDTLQRAMVTQGPTAGIEVCHSEAPAIAGRVMAEHGVRLGRMSVPGRNRNPAQDAAGWQQPVIESFQQAVAQGGDAAAQLKVWRDGLPEGVSLRLVKGIATEPQCQLCHGPAVAPMLAEAIAARYPGDRATGFNAGDLRGVLWVEVPSTLEPETTDE